jgi:uncharacterized glyoxalase superfamily protein PhnB
MRPNRSMPSAPVIPVLGYADVDEAVTWLTETFGFGVRWRAGSHRAQLAIGDAAVAVTERRPDASAAGDDHSVMVRVDDVDAHHEHARARGARILQPPADYPYGERQYTVEDVGGHHWTFSESIADLTPEDWGGSSGH